MAKNEEFMDLAAAIAEAVAGTTASTIEEANKVALASGQTVEDAISALSIKIGEKLELTNVAQYTGQTHVYLHRRSQDLPPQVGVLVEYEGDDEALVHSVALQIASMSPSVVHQGEIADEVIESEKRIAEATAREEGKPDKVIPRIVEGRVKDFFKDTCLVEQAAIFGDTATVGEALDKAGVVVTRFVRFAAGA